MMTPISTFRSTIRSTISSNGRSGGCSSAMRMEDDKGSAHDIWIDSARR